MGSVSGQDGAGGLSLQLDAASPDRTRLHPRPIGHDRKYRPACLPAVGRQHTPKLAGDSTGKQGLSEAAVALARYTELSEQWFARQAKPLDTQLFLGIALTVAVLGVLGTWFYWCGRADKTRQMRPFAMRTLRYAIAGFVVGVAFLTSDFGTAPPEGRLGIVALTVGCFLLVFSAACAAIASNDQSLVVVNLTGRALLLSDPELAPFYTLPAPQEMPASVLPPIRPRTYYVVSPELGHLAAQAGRTDVFTVDARTMTDFGDTGPLQVRRLRRAVPAATISEQSGGAIHS